MGAYPIYESIGFTSKVVGVITPIPQFFLIKNYVGAIVQPHPQPVMRPLNFPDDDDDLY